MYFTIHFTPQEDSTLYGIDWNGPISHDDEDAGVLIPQTRCPLTATDVEELRVVSPSANSQKICIDLYLLTLSFVVQ